MGFYQKCAALAAVAMALLVLSAVTVVYLLRRTRKMG